MRLSHRNLQILDVFLTEPRQAFAGSDLYRRTKIGFSTIYPMLAKFEQAGWLIPEWEQIDPKKAGRPPKRLYRLTPLGTKEAQARFAEFRSLQTGLPQWAT